MRAYSNGRKSKSSKFLKNVDQLISRWQSATIKVMVHHPYVLDFLHEGRLCPMRILLRLPCLKFIFLLHGEKCAECDLGVPIRVSNTEASSCPGTESCTFGLSAMRMHTTFKAEDDPYALPQWASRLLLRTNESVVGRTRPVTQLFK